MYMEKPVLQGALVDVDEESSLHVTSSSGKEDSSEVTDPLEFDSDYKSRTTSLGEQLLNLQCILLNTCSTVAIVFMNKSVFGDPQLRECQVLIAIWHFTATAIVLYISTLSPFRVFQAVRLPLWQMVPISVFFAGFLLLGNLSLALNTVGFYQLAKIMTTPAVVFLNFALFGKLVSRAMVASIVSVCFGVALTNAQLAMSNPLGAVVAVAAFAVTALYQIWIGKKIVDLNVTAPQLLLNQAPISVFILAVVLPFVDVMPNVAEIPTTVLWTLFTSGLVAALLNLSQFLIIGRTSALTFNIISNLKNIIILALSWYQDSRIPTVLDAFGVIFAVGGAYAYAQLSHKAS